MRPTLNQADVELLKGTFATKDDLKGFATKKDLEAMEKHIRLTTKQDLEAMEKHIRLTTKQDLEAMEKRFDAKFPTKDEMKQRFENLEIMIADSFANHEKRILKLEQNAQVALI